MDKENHSLLIVESNNFSKPLNNTFNNIGFLWKIKVERKNIDTLSGINFKEYNFIIFNGYEERLDEYLNYFQQIQKPLLIFFNKPIKFNVKAVKILGIKKVKKNNFIATNCKLNPKYINKLLPKTFIYENTPINFSGYLITDRTCDYIYKTFLGKNIVAKKGNIFCFSFSGWQLGVKNFKPFFSLLLYIFLNYVDFIFLPKPMTSIRIDDWPYTSEGYLKGKKINDEKREKELIELKRFCRLTKSKFDIMVNSHLINQKKNIIPIECKYPKTVSILKELSVLAKVKIGSHGAYHINYSKYLNEDIVDPREFLNVSSKEAIADLEKNINWIKKMFKQNPDVFVPPCWKYDEGLNSIVHKYFKIICFSNYQLKDINNEIFINFNKNITKVYETIKYNPSINIYDKMIWEDYFLCGIPCIYLFHNLKNRSYAKQRILQLLNEFGIYIYIFPIFGVLAYCFTGKINISILIIISLIIFILNFFEFNLKSAFSILKSLFMTNKTLININKNRFCFLNELVEYYKDYESIYFINSKMVNPGGIEYRCINKLFKFEDYNKYLLKLKRIFRKENFMKDIKIFICGNFGYKSNQIDGQTVKTRQLKDVIIKKIGKDNVVYVDTSYAKTSPFFTFNEIKKNIKNSTHLIMLPGSNGLRILLPLFIRWKKKLKIDIRYVVIGGWLPDFLKKKKRYLSLCKKLDKIYIETKSIKQRLIDMGLENVDILTNFRQFNFTRKSIDKVKRPFRLVYFSRILKEKGIELAIESVNKINKKYREEVIVLDIYGPISSNYKKEFKKRISKSEKYICYKGFLEPDNIYKVLSNYDLMIFPTFYKGEGFPGAIIDSFISGVPVLASDWKYNNEIIKENITGKLFVSKDIQDLTNKLEFLINNPDLIYKMKKNCLEEAKKYNADFVLDSLTKDMLIDK